MEIANILLWGLLLVFAIIIEVATTALVSIWFIPGIVVAMILSCFKVSFAIQCVVFLFVSFICLLLTKPIANKIKNSSLDCETDLEKMIGTKHLVIKESLNEFETGMIRIKDIEWSILSIDKTPLYINDIVVIEKIEGNTLYCKKEFQQTTNSLNNQTK